MKTLLILLVLLFSFSVFADDISDFQIEGVSVGDSALDHFTKEHIKNNIRDIYTDKKFTYVASNKLSFFKTYDGLDFHYLTKDNNYKIYSIAGVIYYDKNISECYKKMNVIDNELKTFTNNAKIISDQIFNHPNDPTGKSKVTPLVYELDSGAIIGIQCYDYSLEYGLNDYLEIFIDTYEFNVWLASNPY